MTCKDCFRFQCMCYVFLRGKARYHVPSSISIKLITDKRNERIFFLLKAKTKKYIEMTMSYFLQIRFVYCRLLPLNVLWTAKEQQKRLSNCECINVANTRKSTSGSELNGKPFFIRPIFYIDMLSSWSTCMSAQRQSIQLCSFAIIFFHFLQSSTSRHLPFTLFLSHHPMSINTFLPTLSIPLTDFFSD